MISKCLILLLVASSYLSAQSTNDTKNDSSNFTPEEEERRINFIVEKMHTNQALLNLAVCSSSITFLKMKGVYHEAEKLLLQTELEVDHVKVKFTLIEPYLILGYGKDHLHKFDSVRR